MAPPKPALRIDGESTPLIQDLESTQVASGQALFAHHIPNNFHPPSPSGASSPFFGPDSPSDVQSLKNFICSSYVNVLLVAVPLSFLSHFLHWGSMADFIISFVAIIPLAGLLGDATEQVALKVGSTLGGLLNATFGNAVEAIVGIVALSQNQLRIVQTSMLGSILSNILLVLGCSFIAAGFKFKESRFQATAAQASASLMLLACIALVIPAAYFSSFLDKINSGRAQHPGAIPSAQDLANGLALGLSSTHDLPGKEVAQHGLLVISRGTSVLMLAMYILYLYFQLSTHSYLYEDTSSETEEEEARMNFRTATGALVGVTVVTAFCAEYLVDSIDEFAQQAGIPKAFIGLILLPIVGNAAEHVTAVFMAMKGKMELAIGVAVGSSIQIAVGVIPIMVIIGWATGKELTLFFENFETICLVFSVLLTTLLIQDGKSNYMEGAMLVSLYVIIGLAFWVS
ncbi:calcium/proton exchanger [Puccinia triticina 1-1 BBBD Race 1]|uniref:Vacuolar calcium ion transporter n=2 Tax=Puccinia triticina (isolate 1-1 / race 1 (BBBD)) TaxID=630390 RepID=A0A180G5F4_PUCT1|nr:calcium/proton exchanger [Puccinia triticina 1-1 BBBD Race 1]